MPRVVFTASYTWTFVGQSDELQFTEILPVIGSEILEPMPEC